MTTATPAGIRLSPAQVFATALHRGRLTAVVDGQGHEHRLPVSRWAGDACAADGVLLDRCRGATVDLGCGPGRLTEELGRRGHEVLGVDSSATAVARARRRGIPVVEQSVFDSLPREGRWDTALLADGNIGIGGDPVRLLTRARDAVRPGGRVVLDLSGPGTGLLVHQVHLRSGNVSSTSFPWALLGPDSLDEVGARAGLVTTQVSRRRRRWVAVLVRPLRAQEAGP